MQNHKLTDAQVFTLRRMQRTPYLISADLKRGDEDRSTPRETRRVNAPSLPVLFREGFVEFADPKCRKEIGKWYKVRLTAKGREAVKTATTAGERGELKRGTVRCPVCKVALHWRVFAGMRLVEEAEGRKFYRAECPKCNDRFTVTK